MGFADLRTWLDRFEAAGELKRIKAEVNWDREIGAIARRSPRKSSRKGFPVSTMRSAMPW